MILFLNKARIRAAVYTHIGGRLFDQEVYGKGGDRKVSIFFLAFIYTPGAGRDDLNNDDGVILEGVGEGIGFSDDRHIGVIKASAESGADTDLGIRIERLAGFAAKLASKGNKGVGCNAMVRVCSASHVVDGTIHVFMLDRRVQFAGEVTFDRQVFISSGSSHGSE